MNGEAIIVRQILDMVNIFKPIAVKISLQAAETAADTIQGTDLENYFNPYLKGCVFGFNNKNRGLYKILSKVL